jgi:hypothetical protein
VVYCFDSGTGVIEELGAILDVYRGMGVPYPPLDAGIPVYRSQIVHARRRPDDMGLGRLARYRLSRLQHSRRFFFSWLVHYYGQFFFHSFLFLVQFGKCSKKQIYLFV